VRCPAAAKLVTSMEHYLETFIVVTSAAESRQAAIMKMKEELFPGFAQDDFLLLHSVNFHVKDGHQP
jgi:hypothetical protein